MKNRSWGVAAAALVLFVAGAARSEESVRATQGVACATDGPSCTRFQGYIYVRRGTDAARPASKVTGAAAAGFGDRRVYLNMGAAEAR